MKHLPLPIKLTLTVVALALSSVAMAQVSGCTDPNAANFDPSATIDDGSCYYFVYGCTDPSALNYDPMANMDDGSCIYLSYGCTDPSAANYNPGANVDDGSCYYYYYGCTDPNAYNFDPNANYDDGSCQYYTYGCTDPQADNYDPMAMIDDGSCIYNDCYGEPNGNAYFDDCGECVGGNTGLEPCVVIGLGAAQSIAPPIAVKPNPNNGNFWLVKAGHDLENCSVEVSDLTGRIIAQFGPSSIKRHAGEFHLEVESGTYLIRVTEGRFSKTLRCFVETH